MASNMFTNDCSTVNVYDSLFAALDEKSNDLILKIFQNRNSSDKKAITIVMKHFQRQEGSVDCGLFAITVMASLAHREDPSTVTYDQKRMRKHLIDCFSSKFVMPFPKL